QYCTFLELFDCATPGHAFEAAADRDLTTVEPAGIVEGDQAYLRLPDHLVELADKVAGRLGG
ncbi:MAG TPA: hypothetical protein VLB03_06205, partial [Nocardioidaceae bacterium]|nr:hypothetical protein [Nocardioidaceae bacterium]